MPTISWRDTPEGLRPFLVSGEDSTPVVWAPQPGSQEAFLSCPIYEVLYHGNRGGGKTDCLLMDFAQHVGQGFGRDWRGILFRQTYPQLNDVIEKANKWFGQIFPQAKYNKSDHVWTWPTGESLLFRHMDDPRDYWSYHGHSYPWMGWEELTNWATPDCYLRMMSCARKTRKDIPIKIRATTNPYGAGHNWVKFRWRLHELMPDRISNPVIRDSIGGDGKPEPPRVAIRSRLEENLILLSADPHYIDRILAAATNDAEREAWRNGTWDIVAGGMFSDLWDPRCHIIPNIPFPALARMHGWFLNRSYDHGQSKPFSVGFWAESNGEPLEYQGKKYGTVRGDLIRFNEWYGWSGKPNEGLRKPAKWIAGGIVERIEAMRLQIHAGPADNSIFDDYDPGSSVAGDMEGKGIRWERSDKRPGSRKLGWQKIRDLLEGAKQPKDGYREEPGLFVMERCDQFRRTVPNLSRLDSDPDEINTKAEDHIADETRYRVRQRDMQIQSGSWA